MQHHVVIQGVPVPWRCCIARAGNRSSPTKKVTKGHRRPHETARGHKKERPEQRRLLFVHFAVLLLISPFSPAMPSITSSLSSSCLFASPQAVLHVRTCCQGLRPCLLTMCRHALSEVRASQSSTRTSCFPGTGDTLTESVKLGAPSKWMARQADRQRGSGVLHVRHCKASRNSRKKPHRPKPQPGASFPEKEEGGREDGREETVADKQGMGVHLEGVQGRVARNDRATSSWRSSARPSAFIFVVVRLLLLAMPFSYSLLPPTPPDEVGGRWRPLHCP